MENYLFDRIILTFDNLCNMQCPFCYGLFNGEKEGLEQIYKILEECKRNKIVNISIGGGDPLNYLYINSVIEYAYNLGFIIDLDTNCYAFNYNKHFKMLEKIEYVGVPVDGKNAETHDLIRTKIGSFKKVIEVIETINNKVSINTVVTKNNYTELIDIYNLIKQYKNVNQWYIYEMMPLLVRKEYYLKEHVDYLKYKQIIEAIQNEKIKIYHCAYKERTRFHMFVSASGYLYCNNKNNLTEYKFFGSIFDSKNIIKMKNYIGDNENE